MFLVSIISVVPVSLPDIVVHVFIVLGEFMSLLHYMYLCICSSFHYCYGMYNVHVPQKEMTNISKEIYLFIPGSFYVKQIQLLDKCSMLKWKWLASIYIPVVYTYFMKLSTMKLILIWYSVPLVQSWFDFFKLPLPHFHLSFNFRQLYLHRKHVTIK